MEVLLCATSAPHLITMVPDCRLGSSRDLSFIHFHAEPSPAYIYLKNQFDLGYRIHVYKATTVTLKTVPKILKFFTQILPIIDKFFNNYL